MDASGIKDMLLATSHICESVKFFNHDSSIQVAFDFGDPETGHIWTIHVDGGEQFRHTSIDVIAEVVKKWYDTTFLPF